MNDALYLVNPAGHGGSGIRTWEEFKAQWADPIDPEDVIVTERAGQAREISASRDDRQILVAVGGDGTVGEIMSGIMDRQGPQPRVAIAPGGTGNDIARNIGITSIADAVVALREGHHRAFDLVRVDSRIEGERSCRFSSIERHR